MLPGYQPSAPPIQIERNFDPKSRHPIQHPPRNIWQPSQVITYTKMDPVTLPRSFEDTTPAEMMRDFPRRRQTQTSDSEHPPLVNRDSQQPVPRSYDSISSPSTVRRDGAVESHVSEGHLELEEEDSRQPSSPPPKKWIGKRIWEAVNTWERENVELVLENKQSVARDHLANERTYLAWLRTSLSFASIGVAITQLFRLSTTIQPNDPPAGFARLRQLGRPLGATFIGIAILVLSLGVHRYFTSQYWMTKGKFPASRGAIIVVSAVAAAITVVAFTIVIIIDPDLNP